ncbi:MAG TPA: YlxR family protein [Chloroflexota bacterium]|nr:YlxR family protein [Chloroflexota bacterium]
MPLRPKHIPERTCVACRSVQAKEAKQPKRSLVRLVRSPQGDVSVDLTGKKPGRGAYLCASPICWQVGLTKGAVERALKTALSADERAALQEYATQLNSASGEGPAH